MVEYTKMKSFVAASVSVNYSKLQRRFMTYSDMHFKKRPQDGKCAFIVNLFMSTQPLRSPWSDCSLVLSTVQRRLHFLLTGCKNAAYSVLNKWTLCRLIVSYKKRISVFHLHDFFWYLQVYELPPQEQRNHYKTVSLAHARVWESIYLGISCFLSAVVDRWLLL